MAVSRAEQRERTTARIAARATRLFAERGYDRTSVRDIATAAAVDPALVLHYFGSKQALFREVIGSPGSEPEPIDDPTEFVLTNLRAKLDDHAGMVQSQLRSMLTNPDAAEHARTQLDGFAAALADHLDGESADVRAQLLLATNLGVAIVRELLEVPALARLSPDQIAAAMRPAIAALVDPPESGRDSARIWFAPPAGTP